MKKKISIFALAIVLAIQVGAQTFAIWTKGSAILATPAEVGEMVLSGNQLSVGNLVLDYTDIDSMTYSEQNFDPLLVEFAYSGNECYTRVPLALTDYLTIDKDGAYVTVTSTATADPEITYSLSGSTDNGSFLQDGSYKCGIVLNGINITSQRGAAFHIRNGKRIDIELVRNTTNSFSDYASGIQDACFHVKGHPEFHGHGTLNITGNARHAYKSGEYTLLKRSTGTINILSAPSDGMHIGQYFHQRGGTVNIRNGVLADGIQVDTTNDRTDELNGQILIDSGYVSISLNSDDCDGLKCDSALTITGGNITIATTGKGSKCINVGTDALINAATMTPAIVLTASGDRLSVNGDNKRSMCLKANGDLCFYAGSLTATNTGDKGRSVKVNGNYYRIQSAITLSASPAISIDGMTYNRQK